MTLFVLAYLAGVLTIVSPCIRGPGLRRPGWCVRKSTPRIWTIQSASMGESNLLRDSHIGYTEIPPTVSDGSLLVKEESMPRDSARAPQLHLFVSDTTASPEALARYEAIRPVLKGERSLPQQNQPTRIN
jgi:hypothetical protein